MTADNPDTNRGTGRMETARAIFRMKAWRGAFVALLIAAAARFASEHYGAPTMLFALLIGLSLGFLSDVESLKPGLDFTARTVLRLGVGLLGIQLGLEAIMALGLGAVLLVVAMVVLTIVSGVLLARGLGRGVGFGLLSGGAVGICGASAALALSAVLPRSEQTEKETILVVVTVTVLSTVAMILYPILFNLFGFEDATAGFLIGATVHDVAQVVGAGYSISDEAGLTATLTKMLRVAALPVIVVAIHLMSATRETGRVVVPWFLVLFVGLAVVRSTLPVPEALIEALSGLSRWMMVSAIAAIGIRSDLGAVLRVHPSLILVLVLETLILLFAGLGAAQMGLV